ncbi:MAG: trigger factor [Planctomycetota bacterium]|nr:trigger factor [Planctomycetota bacterium]
MSEVESAEGVATAEAVAAGAGGEGGANPAKRIDLKVQIEVTGPCRKKVKVTVPRAEIDQSLAKSIRELIVSADVPGFRKGRVPRSLVEKKFRKEVSGQVLQRVLMQSLEQLSEEYKLDAINEPDLDVADLEIPEKGDFEFEFEVEVRPEFDLPGYSGLKVQRLVRAITDEDIDTAIERFREQNATASQPVDTPAVLGDFVVANVRFLINGEEIGRRSGVEIRIRPTIQFHDAILSDFDKLMIGVQPGDHRSATATISMEASRAELRGETATVEFEVTDVRRQSLPDLDEKFLADLQVDSVDALRERMKSVLERQTQFRQRQAVREQVLRQIGESANWELPEDLVLRQVENALRREVLEMREAGYTDLQIEARESQMRQNQISETRLALKQHFILDKLATTENIVVEPIEKELEILNMAQQSGESPRKVRAQLERRGMMENLEAQIRERKAVDFIIGKATIEDVPDTTTMKEEAFAVDLAISGLGVAPEAPEVAPVETANA